MPTCVELSKVSIRRTVQGDTHPGLASQPLGRACEKSPVQVVMLLIRSAVGTDFRWRDMEFDSKLC